MSTAKVSKKIKDEAARVKKSILDGKKPEMKFPLRALTNVAGRCSPPWMGRKPSP